MVSLASIIDACKRKDFDAMPLQFPFELMAPLILMVATHETCSTTSGTTLKFFDKKLTATTNTIKSMYSMVNLGDFLQAYYLAADGNAVNDPAIAKVIYVYVEKHATALARFLDDEEVLAPFKQDCINTFPFFKK